jgi:hypothetical protein
VLLKCVETSPFMYARNCDEATYYYAMCTSDGGTDLASLLSSAADVYAVEKM